MSDIERHTHGRADRRFAWLVPLVLAIITAGIYLPVLQNDFVRLDDGKTVYGNQALNHLDAASFSSFWTSAPNDLYMPLTYTMYAGASLAAHGRHDATAEGYPLRLFAWPFHLCSLLIHVLAVMVVYGILRRVVGRRWPAAGGALLFSLHPLQVETVAWISAANGLLCSLFVLGAVYCFLRGITAEEPAPGGGANRSGLWMVLGTEAFAFALLSKPLAVVTPALGCLVWWLISRERGGRSAGGKVLLLWAAIAAAFAALARQLQPIPRWWVSVPIWRRPLIAGDTLTFYFYKIVMPLKLVPNYARPPEAVAAHAWFYLAWIVPAAIGLLLACYAKRRGSGAVIVGGAWFIIALLPVLGFTTFAFQHFSTAADRYLYLPMVGIALIAASVLGRLVKYPIAAKVCTIAILALLATRTVHQIRYWRDTPTLFQHCIDVTGREPGERER